MKKKREVLFKVLDDEGREVVWYKDNWDEHVNYRPELRQSKAIIISAIKRPLYKRSLKNGQEHYFSNIVRWNKRGREMCWKVCIWYKNNSGIVATAMPHEAFD